LFLHRYDSVVLLSFQPWEGPYGAQGYAQLGGMCQSKYSKPRLSMITTK